MSCYICGQAMDDQRLDSRDMKTVPCGTCEAVIQECLDGYPKDPDDPDDYVVYLDPEVEDFSEYFTQDHHTD